MTRKYQSPIGHGEQFTDDNGDPLASGTLNTYLAGTTTNKATFKDNAGAASHTNPIVLGANGRVPDDALWLDNDQDYKFVLKDSGGTTIYTLDNIAAIVPPTTVTVSEWVTGPTPSFIDTTSFSVGGDHTSTLHIFRRLRLTDSSTLYASITAVSYSAGTGLTTVTVIVDGGTSLTNNLAVISYSITSAVNTSVPSGIDMDITAVTLSGSTGVLQTYTLPANTLDDDGKVIRIKAMGSRAGINATITIDVRFGTTPAVQETKGLGTTDTIWEVECYITRISATAADVYIVITSKSGGVSVIVQEFNAETSDINMAADQTFDINVTSINGGDAITQEFLLVERLR